MGVERTSASRAEEGRGVGAARELSSGLPLAAGRGPNFSWVRSGIRMRSRGCNPRLLGAAVDLDLEMTVPGHRHWDQRRLQSVCYFPHLLLANAMDYALLSVSTDLPSCLRLHRRNRNQPQSPALPCRQMHSTLRCRMIRTRSAPAGHPFESFRLSKTERVT
jgi:hypothetical protein